jgi:hypothetical protein
VKPEYAPRRISGGRIRIGGAVYGIGAEISDPAGVVWTLLGLLDGRHSTDDIAARMVAVHPKLTTDDVGSMVAQLIDAGCVEDAGASAAGLLASEKVRYDRSRRFYRWVDREPRGSSWEPQLALRSATVAVVGVGGAGGQVALELARAASDTCT